ncbi:hypothetical protein V490_07865 [Pseudogymnoascus sp. VKM F-3557]|nr:hypothetical protein V490_07865 [Pseudogymnoascus sp. VKM F-3557]
MAESGNGVRRSAITQSSARACEVMGIATDATRANHELAGVHWRERDSHGDIATGDSGWGMGWRRQSREGRVGGSTIVSKISYYTGYSIAVQGSVGDVGYVIAVWSSIWRIGHSVDAVPYRYNLELGDRVYGRQHDRSSGRPQRTEVESGELKRRKASSKWFNGQDKTLSAPI